MRTLLPNGSIAPEPFTLCRQFGYCAHCWRAGLNGHEIRNGSAMQIGNDNFAWFGTTQSKSSRLNFLDRLGTNYTDYAVNNAALRYMHECALAGPIIARLATSSTPSPTSVQPSNRCVR